MASSITYTTTLQVRRKTGEYLAKLLAAHRLAVGTRTGMPTLTGLGYEGLSTAIRHPVKKPKGRDLAEEHQAYNALIRSVHSVAERANPLLKTTFKALRRVSLDPGRIGAIVKAALVLLHLKYDRTI